MKAIQVVQPQSMAAVKAPNPALDDKLPDNILVRNYWASMCGSDIPFFCGRKPNLPYPLRWGFPIHECVGQVVQSTSANYQPGDWVVAMPDGSRGLAEYFLAQTNRAVPLSDGLADKSQCCLIQPLATVINGVDRLGDISGATIAVVGLGSIGLMFCWLLKLRGAGHIIGIDPLGVRCKAAESLGADETHPMTSSDFIHQPKDLSHFGPIDICIEAVGHQMQTINDCFQIIKKRGTVLAFGVPDHEIYSLDYETFFRKNTHLIASVTPDWRVYLQIAHDLFLKHQKELIPFNTHYYPIQDVETAFKNYADHEDGIIKAVIDLTEW